MVDLAALAEVAVVVSAVVIEPVGGHVMAVAIVSMVMTSMVITWSWPL